MNVKVGDRLTGCRSVVEAYVELIHAEPQLKPCLRFGDCLSQCVDFSLGEIGPARDVPPWNQKEMPFCNREAIPNCKDVSISKEDAFRRSGTEWTINRHCNCWRRTGRQYPELS